MRLMMAALAALAVFLASAPVFAQDSTAVRASYWGPIPPEAKETRVTYPRASTHPVEHAILTPFYVVTYPVYIATRVLKKGLVFADEHGIEASFIAPRGALDAVAADESRGIALLVPWQRNLLKL